MSAPCSSSVPAAPYAALPTSDRASAPEADALVAQATAAISHARFFGLFGQDNFEEAAEKFTRAANLYKAARSLEAAADAFRRASECHTRTDPPSEHDAASCRIEAAKCLRKADPAGARAQLRRAVSLFTATGNFATASRHVFEMAQLREEDSSDAAAVADAIALYRESATLLESENQWSRARLSLLRVAELTAASAATPTLPAPYDAAADLFEQVARGDLETPLQAYGVPKIFLRALLCRLAKGDAVAAAKCLGVYGEQCPAFTNQREHAFAQKLIAAAEQSDDDAFTAAVAEYDAVTRLDAWTTAVLLAVKEQIAIAAGDSIR